MSRAFCTLPAVALCLAFLAGPASAACVYPPAYPGDDAPKATIAAWMAGGARDAGLPGELPVMGALADSGIKNLHSGDSDSVGYFQMRTGIWDRGDYAGYPDHPSLQLQWFIDQAQAIRQNRIAAGIAEFGKDDAKWGEWVADVQRPAEQYRYRYQLKLAESRDLITAGCAAPDPEPDPVQPAPEAPAPQGPAEPDLQFFPESVLPVIDLQIRKRQSSKPGAVALSAACTNENCFIRTSGTLAVPGRGLFKLTSPLRKLKKGERAAVTLALSRQARRRVAAARRCSQAVVRVVAANAGGWRISESRTVAVCAPR